MKIGIGDLNFKLMTVLIAQTITFGIILQSSNAKNRLLSIVIKHYKLITKLVLGSMILREICQIYVMKEDFLVGVTNMMRIWMLQTLRSNLLIDTLKSFANMLVWAMLKNLSKINVISSMSINDHIKFLLYQDFKQEIKGDHSL